MNIFSKNFVLSYEKFELIFFLLISKGSIIFFP